MTEVPTGRHLRIALYDAYLATLGGGENLLAAMAECLEQELPGSRLDILTHTSAVGVAELAERFGVDLRRTSLRVLPTKNRRWLGPATPFQRILAERDIARVTAEYDLFVNHTIFSMIPPRSRRSIYVCMFPLDPVPWRLRAKPGSRELGTAAYVELRRAVFRRFLRRYDLIVGISDFTRTWIRRFWRMESRLLYPPVETTEAVSLDAKRRRILSIGRFFPGDHNKKHGVMIDAFRALCRQGLDGWSLHLAGGWTDVPGTREYVAGLERNAAGLDVRFHVDCSRPVLTDLLRTSSLFWHATGYGEEEEVDPYKFEHFGMSTVEAMSHGCVPLVHGSGGQKEVFEDGRSGFLWHRREELEERTLALVADEPLRRRMAHEAHLRSRRYDRRAFRVSVRALLHEILPADWLAAGPGAGA